MPHMMVGKAISDVRKPTDEELEQWGWDNIHGTAAVIVFDDGSIIYPSQDDEGNGFGTLFGVVEGEEVYILPFVHDTGR